MKVSQTEGFKPIVITLETKEEALAFAGIMDTASRKSKDSDQHAVAVEMSDLFTNKLNF